MMLHSDVNPSPPAEAGTTNIWRQKTKGHRSYHHSGSIIRPYPENTTLMNARSALANTPGGSRNVTYS